MPDLNLDKPKRILRFMATGIQRKLDLHETQVTPAAYPFYDYRWVDYPQVRVCPQAKSPSGKGNGGQDGGFLARDFGVLVAVFYRCKLDRYGGDSKIAYLEDAEGFADLIEKIRDVFAITQLGDGTAANTLLFENMRWTGDSIPTLVDEELGIIRQDLSFVAPFAVQLGAVTTLNLSDTI